MKRLVLAMAAVVAVVAGSGCGMCNQQGKRAAATLEGDKITVSETIRFETGKATIDPGSTYILDEVADILKSNPGITMMTIEGHTDSVGDAALNKQLSQDRADAVKAYLVGKGIDAGRMEAKGFGPEQPIASNDTEEGRATNRRVAFKVVR
jgi:outer membrane protein OmpA-like peptidoglycan-associated protein